jgi:ankyrin repeat protein
LILSLWICRYELVEDFLRVPSDLRQDMVIWMQNINRSRSYFHKTYFTALQLSTKDHKVSIVKKLLAHHAIDIDYLDIRKRQRTALQHAVENGYMDLVKLLISHGANINAPPARDSGATALQVAAIGGYLGIARQLIDLGADVNAPGAEKDGRTALEGAAEHGRIDMLQMLLDEGASVTSEFGERQYRRAIELAEQQGHQAAARLLIIFQPRQE